MAKSMNPVVVIPARMASTRLPGKPLAEIGGEPMIVQVWRRAMEAEVGPVIVAVSEREVADAIEKVGGKAIMTEADLPSGSDRVFQAVENFDPDGKFDVVVNLQGDLPALDPGAVCDAADALAATGADIATLVAEIKDQHELSDDAAVKAVVSLKKGETFGPALWFSRLQTPWGAGPHYHHIGIYAYTRAALERFVALPPSPLEMREKLEQLRALEAGMKISAALVDAVPLGVDTPEDLRRIREMFDARK